jgi:hypothetical protein
MNGGLHAISAAVHFVGLMKGAMRRSFMTRRAIMFVVGGVAVAALAAGAAYAQNAGGQQAGAQNTPFNYEIKDGQRVPKPGNRITNPDGSWREETRQGACVTIKEGSPDGSVKTTRKCD